MKFEIETTIQNIPARVSGEYVAPTPSNPNVDPADDPYDCGELAYRVYDRNGREADWLDRIATSEDEARIRREIVGCVEER